MSFVLLGILNSQAAGGALTVDIAVAHISSPYISTYAFSAGFGTKYANPANLPTSTGRGVAFSGSDIAVAHSDSPYISTYPWSAGFGTKYANPAALPASHGLGVAFTA
jgi:hypothetical protein